MVGSLIFAIYSYMYSYTADDLHRARKPIEILEDNIAERIERDHDRRQCQ